MIKTKKILLGTLATAAMVATPIATVVSCGSNVKQLTEIAFHTEKNTGLSMNYTVCTDEQPNNLKALMKKDSTGKWKFKEFKDIDWQDVQTTGEVTINVTLSDYIKENLIAEMKKKGNPKYNEIYLKLASQDIFGDVKFFDTSKDNLNKQNSINISNNIHKLVAKNVFELKFNLILPKWLETDIYGKKLKIRFGKNSGIGKISFSNGMNKKILQELDLSYNKLTSFDPTDFPQALQRLDLTHNKLTSFNATNFPDLQRLNLSINQLATFDPVSLPQGLESLDLSINQLATFDPTHLPQGLKELDLTYNKLTSFDTTHLPKGLKELYLSHNNLTTFNINHLPQGLESLNLGSNNLPQSEKDKITKWWKDHGKIDFYLNL